jgi:hypothetical protein
MPSSAHAVLIDAIVLGSWTLAATKAHAYHASGRRNIVLREYTICMTAMAGVFTLLLPDVITMIDRVSANLSLLLNSILGIVCLTAAQTILAASSWTPADTAATIRIWWRASLILLALRIGLFAAAPARFHHIETVDFAVNYTQDWTLFVFNITRLIWFSIIFFSVWSIFSSYARQEQITSSRWGLWLHASVGLGGLVYVAYQVAYMVAEWAGRPLPGTERTVGSTMISSLVALVIIATAVLYTGPALGARRTCRAMQPLWKAVVANRADSVLDGAQFTLQQRVIRRRQETVDGLTRLSNYYDQRVWEQAHQVALACGRSPVEAALIADAGLVLAAVRAERASPPTAGRVPGRLHSTAHQDSVDWQVALSRALRSPLLGTGLDLPVVPTTAVGEVS